ncbi:glycerate kinase [Egicoccus sp. AB-alg2]|uniref:glycerate kinase n=1 Tax=Egicoccus sp. AB-alg2 TaxID=3242693 RepID=UPI00359D4D89
MRVLVVAERADGRSAPQVAAEVARAWHEHRPQDALAALPLSDGGPGLLDVVGDARDTWVTTEVAGPHGHPVEAAFLLRPDGTAIIEAARAAAPSLAPGGQADLTLTTSFGAGELVQAALDTGARRLVVGVAGLAAADGGAGALTGLGFRLRVEDGSGLKIGGGDLHRIRRVERGWAQVPDGVEVVVLADTEADLTGAPATLPAEVVVADEQRAAATAALATWRTVVERDLDCPGLGASPGAGAGGGLAFGLAAALRAAIRPAAVGVWDLQGGDGRLQDCDGMVVVADPGGAVHRHAAARASESDRHLWTVTPPADGVGEGDGPADWAERVASVLAS